MNMHKALLPFMLLILWLPGMAQDEPAADCRPDSLAQQQGAFAQFLTPDFAGDRQQDLANLFRLGAAYQAMALRCGYIPNEPEVSIMLEQTLAWVSLDELTAAQAVGDDVEKIMIELENYSGDPLTGQLLYNGLEPALGGAVLGCAGCHENEAAAPLTAGTWTRVSDIRLQLPAFEGYGHHQYLVESIVQPTAYLVPDYAATMPDIYRSQLTVQQLADLVAYLDSQDQLPDDESS